MNSISFQHYYSVCTLFNDPCTLLDIIGTLFTVPNLKRQTLFTRQTLNTYTSTLFSSIFTLFTALGVHYLVLISLNIYSLKHVHNSKMNFDVWVSNMP